MIGVLVKTHFIDASVLATLDAITRALCDRPDVEVVLGIDVTQGLNLSLEASDALFRRTRVHLFGAEPHRRHGVPASSLRNPVLPLNWFHSDFSLVDFYLLNPGRYEQIWQVEHDVSIRSGSWAFLGDDYPYDFIAPSLKVRVPALAAMIGADCVVQPVWHWWDAIEGMRGIAGCFFPCVRLSAMALDRLIAGYRSGISGYCEVSVPSVLVSQPGLRIGSLSAVPESRATIYHPHWNKALRDDPRNSFQLNALKLSVD